ncbi:MAG: ABC transporter substrate binding protein [Candidatus Korobacteraceae bacterium]
MQEKPSARVGPRGCREFGATKWLTAAWLLTICALAWTCSAQLCFADSPPAKNVLILFSFSERKLLDIELLKSNVRAHLSVPVNFYVEYMESQRFESRDYQKSLSESLRVVYAKEKLDLVIVVAYPALQFAVEFRDRIFPGVPIVFMWVAPGRIEGRKLWPDVTGITVREDVQGTLDLALRLNPGTKNIAVVTGSSEFESYWLALTHQELGLYANQLNVIDLVGLQTDQLLRQVPMLPPHTVVFFQLIPQESSQVVVGTYDVLAAVSQRFPTYCIHNYCFDHGAIGGSYADFDEQAVQAGALAARVLSGEKPENIPVIHGSHARPQVDWRQLRRWNIPESALPPGTIVLYRQPTVWERYERYIVAGLVLIALQTFLIIGLLWQRGRKQKAEASLHESEKRFRAIAATTPSLLWICGKDGKVTYLNDRRVNFTGRDPGAGFADAWTAFIHPDDLQSVLTANSRALEQGVGFSKEYRLRRRDGVYRWMLDVAAPRINGDGSFAGFIGSATDVTDQKLAQEALERMGGKLIEAQEKERSLIARELHDDICQRLAMLSLELGQVNHEPNGHDTPANTRIEAIQQHCSEIAADLQTLSHELHSSKLDYLGIVAALRSFCRELSQQQNLDVEFTYENVPNPLPADISLCLFRVAQEALHNAVKYSGVTRFLVDLRGTENHIQLEIRDAGVGFNMPAAMRNGGSGLISMQERVHLVKGTFSVESRVSDGTRIIAIVPLLAEMDALGTAVGSV